MATKTSALETRIEELEVKVINLQRMVARIESSATADRVTLYEMNEKVSKRLAQLEPGREFQRQISGH